MENKYDWNGLLNYHVPEWMREAKFGIYTHWGIYSVPACGYNVSWYPFNMYRPGTEQNIYHCKHYGNPENFGYKDFIPMFTGEKFDAEEWAEIFADSGAKFAGPVAEHHDGFSMWDSKVNPWNAAKMGPCRNVVGELEKAIRNEKLKFMVALHHAENWKFYPHWIKKYDTSDPEYAGLYGEPHNMELEKIFVKDGKVLGEEKNKYPQSWLWEHQNNPSKAFCETWFEKTKEVIDNFSPDMIWFDFGLEFIPETYKIRFLRYYLETSEEKGIDPLVTYKHHDLPVGAGMIDLELGRYDNLTYMEWITDTTVDDGEAWGYMKNAKYKTPETLIDYLIDNVSKNGYLLLNVGPKPNGELPDEAKNILKEIGAWLRVNGESIYGTRPFVKYGEGPTKLAVSGSFGEKVTPKYTADDIRFTMKNNNLYAIFMGWGGETQIIKDLPNCIRGEEIEKIEMLGSPEPIIWKMEGRDLILSRPKEKPCKYSYVYKITRKNM